ncbi:adenylyl-sulfate kinase [Virgibacillus phasianinus]|uniref:Adenylyl-sulfate kinase n=1 Tax=Virgibacillus phasianinus TaxID=2017483 RepID=A0A220U277_9BACI|nr:adenylyl-sulfate kinase [Virgibacillus phasianinus]ASK62177.1 adenylyl-sulfate kinase [Virgibacillus phasianinus]
MSTDIVWHNTSVNKKDYRAKNGQHSGVIWLTGLSGSGKSTIANLVNKKLFDAAVHSYILDGDNIRHGLNAGLGFRAADRTENIRRIGEVAKLFADSGAIVLTAFISPYQSDRDHVREILQPDEFLEVHVDCPLAACERRDPKGLYKKARNGDIKEFTGIDSPYEVPESPELILHSNEFSESACANQIINLLKEKRWI